jgi:predicted amidohydrolase
MKLTVSMAQIAVVPSQPDENLRKGEALIAEAARRGSHIVCLPEMWTTGFNWAENERLARERPDIIGRIGEIAQKYKIWVNGSVLALDEENRVTNTSILFDAEGQQAGIYRKTHLFSLLHEDQHMAPGKSLTVIDTPWGKAGLAICYDIRFPELFRTYALKGVKFVLIPMAFPHPRLEHWKILVRARAIENQMFLIGVNQVGREDFGPDGWVTYFGHSVMIDPWGQTVAEGNEGEEMLLTATIDTGQVDEIRAAMTVLQDRRPELYELG